MVKFGVASYIQDGESTGHGILETQLNNTVYNSHFVKLLDCICKLLEMSFTG